MKLNEILLTENAPPSNASVAVRYVTRSELEALMTKHRFVAFLPSNVFGPTETASLTKVAYMATMLSDVPANVTEEQMLKITQLMYPEWDESIVSIMLSHTADVNIDLFEYGIPAGDPTKRPILVTTLGVWAKQQVEEMEMEVANGEKDDFEEDQ